MNPLLLPDTVLEFVRIYFEDRGAHGYEGTAMIKSGPKGVAAVIPDQVPHREAHGVWVEVTRKGQMDLAVALEADELYVARIHSHPYNAFHSPADDANPALTHEGALSIVVPFFGLGLRRGLDACAVLRRKGRQWRDLRVGDRDRWIRTV